MINRVQGIAEDKASELVDDFGTEDTDYNMYLPIEDIWKVWKEAMLPGLDEELTEFVEIIALRVSDSLKRVEYEEFGKLFSEDFTLVASKHEDKSPFNAKPDESDDKLLSQYPKAVPEESVQDQKPEESTQELSEEDFMIKLDDALSKIVSKLPPIHTKSALNKIFIPLASQVKE
jgi:hypothetical protein